MKKVLAVLLLAAMLLAGCGVKTESPKKAAAETHLSVSQPEKENDLPVTPEKTTPAIPEETTPVTPEETTPAEPAETVPEPPAEEPSVAPEEPQQPTPPPAESAPVKPATPPAQTTPEKPSAPQQTPTVSGRPTSSATCKDTGSDKIWDDPDVNEPMVWEVKADPERTEYVQWLKNDGNPYFYYIDTDGIMMCRGRVFGVPLITSYELFMESTWSISDPTIASVNQVGYVVPLKCGDAVISVTHIDPETQEATTRKCEITVVDYPRFTIGELEQRAHEEAKKIAEYALNYEGATTDLERIAVATALVHEYVKAGKGANVYKFEDGMPVSYSVEGYNQPFGTLVSFHSSCAGDTRALGLVLEYMGFEWYHTNENQWDHQWCVVYDVDGQTAFADASAFGIVGYGDRKNDRSNWMQYRYGGLQSFQ